MASAVTVTARDRPRLRAGEGRRLASRTERGRISGISTPRLALDAGDGVISMAAHMRLEEFIKEAAPASRVVPIREALRRGGIHAMGR
jgi:hypothetical protein